MSRYKFYSKISKRTRPYGSDYTGVHKHAQRETDFYWVCRLFKLMGTFLLFSEKLSWQWNMIQYKSHALVYVNIS